MRILPLVLIPLLLAGCGLKHEEYHNDREIPKGPGAVTGEDGGLTYSGDPLGLRDDDDKDDATPQAKPEHSGTADEPTSSTAGSSDFSDYQEFLRYKEFQRWKETAQGSPEYREFQDWREWKEFRRWQRQKSQ